jgi:hypothetical protein
MKKVFFISLLWILSTPMCAQDFTVFTSIGRTLTVLEAQSSTINTFALTANKKLSKRFYGELTISGVNIGQSQDFFNFRSEFTSTRDYFESIDKLESINETSLIASLIGDVVNNNTFSFQYGIGLSLSQYRTVRAPFKSVEPGDYFGVGIESRNGHRLNPEALLRLVPNLKKVYWGIEARYSAIDPWSTDATLTFNMNIGVRFD